ncbi:hypothetical protein SAM23877_0501 [Streptomyces ambofaciens ATCC 23877]|uniref:Uncharacterized protein n=1 Tax=Streptomyces ambofaciens (strain ATCC 23877 / 3486 / DSM 40053 / JCM 4204 / NBRC 12836 / NRRL B-2516) TaxID=278992 RepID=A0A0K2AKF9_STRA7|nr:hypothetical protein SAM23877_0501 [Streptomyces ambofaciens ATCC 23877]
MTGSENIAGRSPGEAPPGTGDARRRPAPAWHPRQRLGSVLRSRAGSLVGALARRKDPTE